MEVEGIAAMQESGVDGSNDDWVRLRDSIIARDTNVSRCFRQMGSVCYSFAAASAYMNTCARIYGCDVPDFVECQKIAQYSDDGGRVEVALERLEAHFRRGIRWETKYASDWFHGEDAEANAQRFRQLVRHVFMNSVCLSFATSKRGWAAIAQGQLVNGVGGADEVDGRHAVLMEGIDFHTLLFRCKNSWGLNNNNGRFDLNLFAVHNWRTTQVYFTLSSIADKGYPTPRVEMGRLYVSDDNIHWRYMSKHTAHYSSQYICFPAGRNDEGFAYYGYDAMEYFEKKVDSGDVCKIVRVAACVIL